MNILGVWNFAYSDSQLSILSFNNVYLVSPLHAYTWHHEYAYVMLSSDQAYRDPKTITAGTLYSDSPRVSDQCKIMFSMRLAQIQATYSLPEADGRRMKVFASLQGNAEFDPTVTNMGISR